MNAPRPLLSGFLAAALVAVPAAAIPLGAAVASVSSDPALTQDQAAGGPVAVARERWRAAAIRDGEDSPDALIAEWDYAVALTHAGDLGEAEPRWRRMMAVAAPLGADSSLLAQIRLQLAANLVRQGKAYDEAESLAVAGLPVMLAEVGEGHEIVGLGRMALATARVMQGRYAEAEAPARAAYEAALARGDGRGVAPVALLLNHVYQALDRPDDARAVMLRADPAQSAYSSRRHRLSVLRDAGRWEELAVTARDAAADWRTQVGDPLALSMAQEAELDLVSALTRIAMAGGPADFDEAATTVARVREELRAGEGGWTLARALNLEADLYLAWPGRTDLARVRVLKGEALAVIEADVGPDHPQALGQRLAYGLLLLHLDPPAAAPVLAAYYAAARRGLVAPSDWAQASVALADALAQAGLSHDAYAMVADAADALRRYARSPERRGDGQRLIDRHGRLFRTQVALAWRLAEGGG